ESLCAKRWTAAFWGCSDVGECGRRKQAAQRCRHQRRCQQSHEDTIAGHSDTMWGQRSKRYSALHSHCFYHHQV
ncbi:hypothetical protein GOODEAATRI_016446, partial [Goodea atripinnis]